MVSQESLLNVASWKGDHVCELSLNPIIAKDLRPAELNLSQPHVFMNREKGFWHQIHITFSFRGNGWQGEK